MSNQPNVDLVTSPIILDTHGSRTRHWISRLASTLKPVSPLAETRLPTICHCVVNQGKLVLRLPADMHTLQPTALEHIQDFAHQHGFVLAENRRRVDIQPIVERRNIGPKKLADGLGLLLKQAGLPGAAKVMSQPHTLAISSSSLPIHRLIALVSESLADSEHCVLTPKRLTERALGHGMNSIACYTGVVDSASGSVAISHFMSRNLRCIGYSSGRQYVVHQLIGGGSMANCDLWVSRDQLADCDFRVQIFQETSSKTCFSLFYRTVYLDMDENLSARRHNSASQSRIADTHEFALG